MPENSCVPRNSKTYDQIQRMQTKAIRFLRDVVGDSDKADKFAGMTPEEYADQKGIDIKNPNAAKGKHMRKGLTRAELQDRVDELEEENQTLNDKLDSILDIASEDVDEEDEDEDDADADDD